MKESEGAILNVLNDLMREEDVLACMVARKGFEGIMPPVESFKIKNVEIWYLLQDTMDPFFDIIKQFEEHGLDKVYFEIGDYTVMFTTLISEIALVCIVPALANRGLLEVEIENSRRDILKMIEDVVPER
ncbi:MAG: hypothetical protein ABIG20_01760 [archaeon]